MPVLIADLEIRLMVWIKIFNRFVFNQPSPLLEFKLRNELKIVMKIHKQRCSPESLLVTMDILGKAKSQDWGRQSRLVVR